MYRPNHGINIICQLIGLNSILYYQTQLVVQEFNSGTWCKKKESKQTKKNPTTNYILWSSLLTIGIAGFTNRSGRVYPSYLVIHIQAHGEGII